MFQKYRHQQIPQIISRKMFARSVDPIISQEVTITRVAITTEKDAENKSTEMGRKSIVPYALYRAEGYISANLARKVTGFSEEDLEFLWEAIINMFEIDHSAARGKMSVRELIVFKHSKVLGDCPAYKLFDAVEVNRKDGVIYPRKYSDYVVKLNEEQIPGTVEGELLHKRAHDTYSPEKRKDVIISRGMPVHSKTMGVSGVCDIVEFRKSKDGIQLFGKEGYYQVYPVEYKKGKPKDTEIDILQLSAQTMCLEEMFSTDIMEGAIFYGEVRHREIVKIDDALREKVKDSFLEMHQLIERRYTPKVKWSKSCNGCSLKEICIPRLGKTVSVSSYIKSALEEGED